jgi:cell division septal protein FtsQ
MFGKKTKKSERQWSLDVRSRSKPLQALRLRMATGALAISTGVVLTLFLCWKGGEFLLERCVYTNPNLALRRFEIETDGIIPIEQIRAWVNVQPGQNLLSLDLARIKRDLELVPLVESASVERILPSDLVVRVREREPIARVIVFSPRENGQILEPSSLFLDAHGMVIPPVLRSLNTAAFDAATKYLPTLTGVGTTSFAPGHLVRSPQVTAALDWIRAFRESEMVGHVQLRAIDISSPTALLVTTEHGNEVSFSYRNFEPQLARWRRIHQELGRHPSQRIATLDLAVTNYVPAVVVRLTNAQPATIRVTQPSPYRKKHV